MNIRLEYGTSPLTVSYAALAWYSDLMPLVTTSAASVSPSSNCRELMPNMPTPMMSVDHRNGNFDILRAAAIAMVVAFHIGGEQPGREIKWLAMAQGGWAGVDLFFVLSGFLIGGLYWRERSSRGSVYIGRFLQRRWFRTIPPYIVALHLTWIGKLVVVGAPLEYAPTYLLFIQNYTGMPYFGVSWSLCIEEHFYLVLPIALLLVRKGTGAVHVAFAIVFVAPLFSRLFTQHLGSRVEMYATHNHCEGLILGVWLSYCATNCPEIWKSISKWCSRAFPFSFLAIVFLLVSPPSELRSGIGVTAIAGCFGIMVATAGSRKSLSFGGLKILSTIASCSYSIYLTHYLIVEGYPRIVQRRLDFLSPSAHVIIELILILGVGYCFHMMIERTTLRIRDRISPRR